MLAKMPAPLKGLSSLIEPLYAPGHVLMDDDLTAGVLFTRNLSRLLFRSLFGCGVICGYGVLPKVECERLKVTVLPGVALDCCGDPVEMRTSETLTIGDCGELLPSELWVLVRRAQHACAPRELACPSDDEDDACGCHATRSRAGFELKVTDRPPGCVCACAHPPTRDTRGVRAPERPAKTAPPEPTVLLAEKRPGATPAELAALAKARTAARAELADLNDRMVAAAAEFKTAAEQFEAAKAAFEAADREPAPKSDAAAKARAAKLAELRAAIETADKAGEDATKRIDALKVEFNQSMDRAADAEQEWQAASAGASAGAIHRVALGDPSAMIAPLNCHEDHYAGVCGCCCDGDCDGWVVLAMITPPDPLANGPLAPDAVDYGVRRFIRPVLAADPYWTDPPTAGA